MGRRRRGGGLTRLLLELSHFTIERATLSRRSAVFTRNIDTSRFWAIHCTKTFTCPIHDVSGEGEGGRGGGGGTLLFEERQYNLW